MVEKKKFGLTGLFLILAFVGVSFLAQNFIEPLADSLEEHSFYAVIFYIFIGITTTVFAPLSSLPLIPIASSIFGWFYTAIYSIIAWFIGSIIAFFLAKNYGRQFLGKLFSLKDVDNLKKRVKGIDNFWSLLLLRVFLPVDLLSYALGLFTNISYRLFIVTTFLGIIPFAFFLAILGKVPFYYQLGGLIILFSVGYLILERNKKN